MNVSGTDGNFIGNYNNYDSNWGFDGMIDEIGVWSRALTSGEVTQLYNSGAGLQYPFTSNNTSAFFNLM
jgi:hypothetical protein